MSELYYRCRPGAASVFRIGETAGRRVEMTQIATVNLRNGTSKPANATPPSPEEDAQIAEWTQARRAKEADARKREAETLADTMGSVTHWLRTEATEEDVDHIERRLTIAMHDLRRTLMRRKS